MSTIDEKIKDAVQSQMEFQFSQMDEGVVAHIVKYADTGWGVYMHYNGRYLGKTSAHGTDNWEDALSAMLDIADTYFSNPDYQCKTAPASPKVAIAYYGGDVSICTINAKELSDVTRAEVKMLFHEDTK